MIKEKELTHGSLFSGVGGFNVGAERAGVQTLWDCEIEKYQQKVLKKLNPNSILYEDITKLQNPSYVDIISGGFPCQDISPAGSGSGINGERSGLWREMARIVGEVRPQYVIIENSPTLLIRGFEQVLCNLSEIGYYAEWQCLSNALFGYPHQRERLYVIAYPSQNRLQTDICQHGEFEPIFKRRASSVANAHAISKGILEIPNSDHIGAYDGLRHWTHRVASIGNSVNPTIAHYLFECIKIHANKLK